MQLGLSNKWNQKVGTQLLCFVEQNSLFLFLRQHRAKFLLRKSVGVVTRVWTVSLTFSSKFVSLSVSLRSLLWSRVTVGPKQQETFYNLSAHQGYGCCLGVAILSKLDNYCLFQIVLVLSDSCKTLKECAVKTSVLLPNHTLDLDPCMGTLLEHLFS